MQSQQEFYNASHIPEESIASLDQRQRNTDSREQTQLHEETFRSYEDGYPGQNERDFWQSEGDKLRPAPKDQRSIGGLLALLALICAAFLAGSFFGVILTWLTWLVVLVLIIAGAAALATNWRVVTMPMPMHAFQINEHARLVIKSGAGTVAIRRGEEGIVSVIATKRASGIGIGAEHMQINYNQYGDMLDISSSMTWSMLQFGLRTVDFEITVPSTCDIQLLNSSGRVAVQGVSGVIRVFTSGGSIHARDLQGQIAMKTGGGRIEASNLQGLIDLRTGGGRIEAQNLKGRINLHTGGSHIILENMYGQLTIQTGGGRIVLNQAELRGESSLKTGGGSITFAGSLDAHGSYQFQTGGGTISLELPDGAAFSLDAKTGGGNVYNAFGNVEIGNQPRPPLKLRTGGGEIRIARNGQVQVQ